MAGYMALSKDELVATLQKQDEKIKTWRQLLIGTEGDCSSLKDEIVSLKMEQDIERGKMETYMKEFDLWSVFEDEMAVLLGRSGPNVREGLREAVETMKVHMKEFDLWSVFEDFETCAGCGCLIEDSSEEEDGSEEEDLTVREGQYKEQKAQKKELEKELERHRIALGSSDEENKKLTEENKKLTKERDASEHHRANWQRQANIEHESYLEMGETCEREVGIEHERYLETQFQFSEKLWEVCQELDIENNDKSENIIKEIKKLKDEIDRLKKVINVPEGAVVTLRKKPILK